MHKILDLINSSNTPIKVSLNPEPYAKINNCFYNVEDKISKDKGDIIYGWKLHETVYLQEAERHAIWKSPEGYLLDITPDPNYNTEILFLEEDGDWMFDGSYNGNLKVNNTDNPLIDDLILVDKTITSLWRKGNRISRTHINVPDIALKFINDLESLVSDKKSLNF
ncbi:hypothetical protein A8C32_05295 [Flavivirga aquatica]|uniref:Uncharacterized protein n=1 Tax=Flavivirga aquatica TaxID=1849968 RepID=A0A1E5SHS2_9FLAO|nr:hypothetical protein [Flavivirga aquatica]OEJ98616.1 hypothetical protein A8C32_05295 [Flavivirga aquatica]